MVLFFISIKDQLNKEDKILFANFSLVIFIIVAATLPKHLDSVGNQFETKGKSWFY